MSGGDCSPIPPSAKAAERRVAMLRTGTRRTSPGLADGSVRCDFIGDAWRVDLGEADCSSCPQHG